jgi:DNA-binding NarL/FixJ family response regulator
LTRSPTRFNRYLSPAGAGGDDDCGCIQRGDEARNLYESALALCEDRAMSNHLIAAACPSSTGSKTTRQLLADDLASRVLMLPAFDEDEYVYDAMKSGASGFLLKDIRPEQLAEAVRVAAAGDALLAPSITRRLIEEFVRRPSPGPPVELSQLTERELEVLKLIARGLSNAEIASTLFVSEATGKTHVTHVLTKLSLRGRVQAVVLAYESGLVQAGDEREE